ncbi:MAG: AMED_5909 family protein [Pseudonocardiaceae bacterium]
MNKTVTPGPRTLMAAHEELVRIRPGGDAPLGVWFGYYERSVALYELIAKIDPFHDGEARYWAWRERRRAEKIAARIIAERPDK